MKLYEYSWYNSLVSATRSLNPQSVKTVLNKCLPTFLDRPHTAEYDDDPYLLEDYELKKELVYLDNSGLATDVLSFSKSEEPLKANSNKTLVFVVPGNPGTIGFYEEFMKQLYLDNEDKYEVWGVSHTGHVLIHSDDSFLVRNMSFRPRMASLKEHFTEKGLIQHQLDFLSKYIPPEMPVIIVGHSMGCHLVLEMLKAKPNIKVEHIYLLFPAMERLCNGLHVPVLYALSTYLRTYWLCFAIFLALIPRMLLEVIFRVYFCLAFPFSRIPGGVIQCALNYCNPLVVDAICYTTEDIIDNIGDRNDEIIARYKDKMTLYYGRNDHWTPREYYDALVAKFPDIDARLCTSGFRHAFIIDSGKEVGKMVKSWMEQL